MLGSFMNGPIPGMAKFGAKVLDGVSGLYDSLGGGGGQRFWPVDKDSGEIREVNKGIYRDELKEKTEEELKQMVAENKLTMDNPTKNNMIGALTDNRCSGKFCFGENTEILLADKTKKKIKDIEITDKLYHGNQDIISKQIFEAKNAKMYRIDGILVSDFHKMWEDGKWIFVKNSIHATPIEYSGKYIYCLSTSEHFIIINTTTYSDYEENDNMKYLNEIKAKLSELNDEPYNFLNDRNYYCKYEPGFADNTLIKNRDNTHISIKNINIGDEIDGGNVIGKTIINPKYTTLVFNPIFYTYLSPNIINKNYKDKYGFVCDYYNNIDISNTKPLINISTSSGFIKSGSNIYLDYLNTNL